MALNRPRDGADSDLVAQLELHEGLALAHQLEVALQLLRGDLGAGINPIATLEKQPLNMIGNLV